MAGGRGRARARVSPERAALAPLTLLRGPEELLARRAEEALVAQARAVDPDVEVRRLSGGDLPPEHVSDLLAPDLFGMSRLVRVRQPESLAEEAVALLLRHAEQADGPPAPGGTWVVVRALGTKVDAAAADAVARGAVVVDCSVGRGREALDALAAEARTQGVDADQEALELLATAVGGDLLGQATALEQLVGDLASGDPPRRGRLEVPDVALHHAGRAETGGFDVAEAAVGGDRPGALGALRWALATGTPELLVVSALAMKLRDMARVAALGRRSPDDVASRLRMPSWRVRNVQRQLSGWEPDGLAGALTAVARADADVKGGGTDSGHAVERAVLAVLAARTPR